MSTTPEVLNGTTPDPFYLASYTNLSFITEAPGAITIGVIFAVLVTLMFSCCILSDVFSIRKHCLFACRNCSYLKKTLTGGKKNGEMFQQNISSIESDEVFTVTGDKKSLTAAEA